MHLERTLEHRLQKVTAKTPFFVNIKLARAMSSKGLNDLEPSGVPQ